jgi:hypothetical protein
LDANYLADAAEALEKWMARVMKLAALNSHEFSQRCAEKVKRPLKPLKVMVGGIGIEPMAPTMSR